MTGKLGRFEVTYHLSKRIDPKMRQLDMCEAELEGGQSAAWWQEATLVYSTPVLCLPGIFNFPKPVVSFVVVSKLQNKHLFIMRVLSERQWTVLRISYTQCVKTQPTSGSITLTLLI